ncbi:plastocyanin/azurin family copper-binding protein [Rhizobium ruizarguesonis]|uniref:plastocyanin/azurin family copper-binding protein n=1 Tax=Rhizobium leguminosarum TaxID=384 RepID=UPI00104093DD|nr:plastocyanin/azurin family copper-binding protein [Rhizobium leguminosarum]MBY5494340.1 pseudoazurin [Rhizobium leguminosarum]TBZ40380.1 pseudoazurin [Rhizobium leguminosarum bv. viciae]TCA08892.1 pseudoazurin [Rhizobium leguminosarum bv. viciae]TCA19564.1 pseudoazurin [Rhizobium leguminosarum bv. viciae]
MKSIATLALAASAAVIAGSAAAADFEVHMLNKGADGVMVFDPLLTKVKDMIPDGAAAFRGKTNETVKQTFSMPGACVIKCLPHFPMGMVAVVVVVGDAPANLDKIESAKLPNKARERVDKALSEL